LWIERRKLSEAANTAYVDDDDDDYDEICPTLRMLLKYILCG